MTHPLIELVGYIEKDLGNVRARLTELRAHLVAANLQPVELPRCEICGPLHLPPTTSLEDHMANLHSDTIVHPMPQA